MDNTQDISQEEWEAMDRYLLENMTPDEHAEFETRLSSEHTLPAKLAELRLLMMGVNEAVLQEKLDAFHSELPEEEKESHRVSRQPSSFKTWLVAASILLIAGITGWLLLARMNDEEKLFASYFKPDPGLITAMSATDNYAFEKAMIDYKKGEYSSAIQTWDSLHKRMPANDTLPYFLGVAHLANKNAGQAIPYLEKVTKLPGSFFRQDAYWYLGLALLKEGKKELAVAAIEKASHQNKAGLLKELKDQ